MFIDLMTRLPRIVFSKEYYGSLFLVELQDQFDGVHQSIMKLLELIPSILVASSNSSLDEVNQLNLTNLPSPQLYTECQRWKTKWISATEEERPQSFK